MLMPLAVRELIEKALRAVQDHSQHALLPVHRSRIYKAIGPLSNSTSYQVRGHLELLCARRGLVIWQQAHSQDNRAEQLLFLARRVFAGQIDHEIAKKEVEQAQNWLSNDYKERTEKLAQKCFYVLAAIIEATYVVLGYDRWYNITIHKDETDSDLDPWSSDTAKWTAAALAGPVWESGYDSCKRLEFWKWWLTEAISLAYQKALFKKHVADHL